MSSTQPMTTSPYDFATCPGCSQDTTYTLPTATSPFTTATSPATTSYTPYLGTATQPMTQATPTLFQQMPVTLSPVTPAGTGLSPDALAPITPLTQPMPVSLESLQYMNGFLRTQIGRKVTAQFLIGTNTLVDRTGTLLAVGANYILINETETDDILLCDFYTLKFIKFYY